MALPTAFDEADCILGPPAGCEQGVVPLPVKRHEDGYLVSCWQLTPEELELIQKTGKVWLSVWGRTTQPPVLVTAVKEHVLPTG